MNNRLTIFALMPALLGGCAAVVEGTSQEIVVETDPPGADCDLIREELHIAEVNPTPGAVTIKKTKHDISINCELDGYEPNTYLNKSDVAAATFGNLLIGGLVGIVVDAASGANNKYESHVNITLTPKVVPPIQPSPLDVEPSEPSDASPEPTS